KSCLGPGSTLHPSRCGQELAPTAAFSATLLNVLLAFEPSVVMAATHTTMMSASITAYSTAVGPLSSCRKACTLASSLDMSPTLSRSVAGGQAPPVWPRARVSRLCQPDPGLRRPGPTSSPLRERTVFHQEDPARGFLVGSAWARRWR